ncbi:MAG: transcription elongation factor GreA [Bacteroides sp.]|nr:transcription elongation factor GreA [Prevotella sp.]MCM1407954.1 transcription elongation factor GreA [Treponema brennaborense]MCM1469696.1 transcription elongation factor GreA [Bacteroides sp.]
MSENLIESVQEMLNEEKWTRAAISNYSKNNFIELADIVKKTVEENCIDEIKTICDEHLSRSKNSIIGLYLAGMLGLKKRTLDNSSLVTLITIFTDNHKKNVVEYLAESILEEDSSNKFALRTLADCYKENGDERIWNIYETIVKLDFEEADIAKLLAEHYEKEGNKETAIDFYKKALLRYVARKSVNQVKTIWTKLISEIPEEIDFFYLVQRKFAKAVSEEKSEPLLQELYVYYKDEKKWDTAIDILKLILAIDEKDNWARKEIIECFRGKYENHSQLEDCIRISNFNYSWRNIFEAIADFEKHIAFDAKNFVFHRSWGVGIIRSVKRDDIVINFGKKHGIKTMSLKMAVEALQPLAKDHIWVLKATKSKDELAKKIKEDKVWALKTIIKSFDNNCDFKRIKAELVPSILSAGEWVSWNTAAKKILENDATFGVNTNNIAMYTVRERAISQEEKLANEFKAQKNFFSRIDILMKFAEEADTESELFTDMFSYFTGYLRAFSSVNEQTVAAYLIIRKIVSDHPHLNPGIQYTFAQLFSKIENPNEMYLALKNPKHISLRENYLECIKNFLPDWADIYIKLFPTALQPEILATLVENGHADKVTQLALTAFENYRDYREAVIFFFEKSQDEEWFAAADIPYEKQLITLIHILDLTYREISNHRETTENRKINKHVQKLLFDNNDTLLQYMLVHDIDTITRLYTLVDDVKDLDPSKKMNMRNRILEKNPGFKFYGVEEKTIASRGLIVTSKLYDEKQKLLEHLLTVEVPANSKEIGEALAMGDLRENAEYKAARERQTQLNATVTRLQDEIDRAQVFDPTTITTARVSFGTTVTLSNKQTGTTETYTILGPWESDPENGVISYMSPFGNAILNSKEQDDLSFTINEREFEYRVESIAAASF